MYNKMNDDNGNIYENQVFLQPKMALLKST